MALALTACATPPRAGMQHAVPACPADATVMDGWDDRAPPRRVFGNTWYVGTCGLTALLVATPHGHVLVDGAGEAAGPHIEANIRALGFDPREIRHIVNSHEHFDHAGGIAYLQRVSGAQVWVREPAAATFRSGQGDRSDPQFLDGSATFPSVANVQVIADGQALRLGELVLRAHATPGHAPGGTTWTWRSCEGQRCLDMAYADSVSAISDDVFRYSDHPDYVEAFRHGLATIGALPCDVLIAPHPLTADLFARLDGRVPLVDSAACKRYSNTGRNNLDQRLRTERETATP